MGASQSANGLGKHSTAKDVVDVYKPDLKGKVAIVTGGNSGIGLETCKALASAGARVVMCSRNVDNGEKAIRDEIKVNGSGGYAVPDANVVVKQLDLADLVTVKKFADEILSSERSIDYLVLNAAVMACPKSTTKQGFEMQIGTNHFGHFYLTSLLLPKMRAQEGKSRIVVVASRAHEWATIHLDDLHCEQRSYSGFGAYGESKAANILFAKGLADRLAGSNVTAISLHPGVIITPIQKHMSEGWLKWANNFFFVDKTIPQGAATTLYACLAPEIESQPGAYFYDCAVSRPSTHAADAGKTLRHALWDLTGAQLAMAGYPTAPLPFPGAP